MSKKLSMSDLARAAGVSKNTISLALRNDPRISAAVREKVKQLAEQLDYRKNPLVGQLMARLRTDAVNQYKATLAILNANEDAEAFRCHPTFPRYVEGCLRRARQQGYGLDEFWLGDPRIDGARLSRVLDSRGIRGVLVVGMAFQNRLPAKFLKVWQEYACVVTGIRTHEPAMHFSCVDHHDLAIQAVENALRLGYRRPALVLDERVDSVVDGRFSAGVQTAQKHLPPGRRLAALYTTAQERGQEPAFRRWYTRVRPDVILTLFHTVAGWIQRMGLKVPEDVGLIQLEWRRDHAHWAGMNQHNDLAGEAAVDMLISMIHNGESGIPVAPRATLIGSSWTDGSTVRRFKRRAKEVVSHGKSCA